MERTLVIGYGNVDRKDDGVAFHVVNTLRRRLGQPALSEDETGLGQLGARTDSVFVLQLFPEHLEIAASYDQIVFVDARVGSEGEDLLCLPVGAEYSSAPFTHHVTPKMFLALLDALYRRTPTAWVVSIRGHEFEFRRGLSPAAADQVEPAAARIEALLG